MPGRFMPLALGLWSLLSATTAAASEPRVLVRTLDGGVRKGERVLELDSERLQLAAGDSVTTIPRVDILTLRLTPRPLPDETEEPIEVALLYGDRVRGRFHAIDEAELTLAPRCRTGDDVLWTIPLEQIRAITLLARPPVPGNRRPAKSPEPIGGDRVRLLNGDQLRGDLLAVDAEQITLSTGDTDSKIPWSNITELAFNPELGATPELPSSRSRLGLFDGSILTISGATISKDGVIAGDAPFASTIALRLDAVESLTFLSPRVVPLSEIPPANIATTPFLETVFAPRTNQSVLQTPLKLRGRRYLSGYGLHSQTTLTFPLAQPFERLVATLGIDDASAELGHALVDIRAGDRRPLQALELSSTDPPRPISYDLAEADELRLTVQFGRRGSVGDFVDIADAFLIRPGSSETDADSPPRRD